MKAFNNGVTAEFQQIDVGGIIQAASVFRVVDMQLAFRSAENDVIEMKATIQISGSKWMCQLNGRRSWINDCVWRKTGFQTVVRIKTQIGRVGNSDVRAA